MPPLMGAGAFVMVELTGIPYTEVILAASIPALLYFYTVWIGVNRYAELFNLRPVDASEQPSKLELAITVGFFVVPFAVLLWLMFSGYTPQYAAALATVVAMLLLFTGADARLDLKRGFTRLGEALTISGRQISMIASIILCASLIVGVLGITGLGVKITSLILSVSGDSLYLTLGTNSGCLSFFRYGGTDNCRLCYLCVCRRSGTDRPRLRAYSGSFVCFLVRLNRPSHHPCVVGSS